LQEKVLNKLKRVFGLAAEESAALIPGQETTTDEHELPTKND
jgi:hypothetical protein